MFLRLFKCKCVKGCSGCKACQLCSGNDFLCSEDVLLMFFLGRTPFARFFNLHIQQIVVRALDWIEVILPCALVVVTSVLILLAIEDGLIEVAGLEIEDEYATHFQIFPHACKCIVEVLIAG